MSNQSSLSDSKMMHATDEQLLLALLQRAVVMRRCTDVDDKSERCEVPAICGCNDQVVHDMINTLKKREIAKVDECLCLHHTALRATKDHRRWCEAIIALPNGDAQRCQRAGPYDHKQQLFMCESCSLDYAKADKEELV